MTSRNLLILLLVLSLALASFVFEQNTHLLNLLSPQTTTSAESDKTQTPEYRIHQLHSKNYHQESGKLESRLNAQELTFYSADQSSFLTRPVIELYPVNHQPAADILWIIRSDKAETRVPNTIIHLLGNVAMERPPQTSDEDTLHIETHEVTILLDEKIAHSESAVKIYSGQNKTSGTGFRAHMADETIKILDSVKSEYQDNKQQFTHISSQLFFLENLKGQATYTSDVKLTQENIQIFADKLQFIQQENRRVAIATGAPVSFKQKATQGRQDIFAQAMRMEFETEEKILKMYDKARLQQGDATVEGDYLYYDTRKETIGAESTESSRVKLVIPAKAKETQ